MSNTSTANKADFEYYPVCPSNELSAGERLLVEIDGNVIVLFCISDHYYAIDNLCSHEDNELEEGDLEGYELTCPHHGARFDIRTGKALSLPAVADINSYPVRIKDGQVEIGIPLS